MTGALEAVEKIVSRANRDLESCRLLAKDILWPLLPRIVDGKQRFDWRAGLRSQDGEEGEDPKSGQIVTIGLVARTADDRFTIGAAPGVKRQSMRHGHCGRRGILDRGEVLIDPSLAWKEEIAPWALVEREAWNTPAPSKDLLRRIEAWAANTGHDRITLSRAEAKDLIREHSPPRIWGWRFVLAPGWTLKRARAEAKEAEKQLEKGVVIDHERLRWIGATAKLFSKSEARENGGLTSLFSIDSITLHGDNRWPPCITMTIPWEFSGGPDHGFNGMWEREDEPFDGNLYWECPEFIESVEVLTDPKTNAFVTMKPRRRKA